MICYLTRFSYVGIFLVGFFLHSCRLGIKEVVLMGCSHKRMGAAAVVAR